MFGAIHDEIYYCSRYNPTEYDISTLTVLQLQHGCMLHIPMIVYTDGSRIPGQNDQGYAGMGIWFGPNDCRNTSIPITIPGATNQLAELMAIHHVLTICRDIRDILIRTDSEYSMKCITVWSKTWISNGWKNSKHEDVVNADLIKKILEIISYRDSCRYTTSFEHVYGHQDSEGNNGADKLAVAGSRKHERYVMDNMVYFYSHRTGDYKCFSQFYPCSFQMQYNDQEFIYNCAEQHHHHQKALLFDDTETASKIMNSQGPGDQKRLGRSVKGFNQDKWLSECYEICKRCTIAKFTQNPDLLQILMSTKGRCIAEAAENDPVWGIGMSAASSRARVKWRGKNLLGKVLMDVRDNVFS